MGEPQLFNGYSSIIGGFHQLFRLSSRVNKDPFHCAFIPKHRTVLL